MNEINGKPLSKILEELRAPFDGEYGYLMKKYPYIKIGSYEDRLNRTVGFENYMTKYTDFQMHTFPNGQIMCTVKCTLYFLDSEKKAVFSVEGIGSNEVSLANSSSLYQNVNNVGYNTQVNAFKSACKSLLMFGIHAGDDSEEVPGNMNLPTAAGNHDSQSSEKASEKVSFISDGTFIKIKDDTKTQKPIYKLLARKVIGNKMSVAPVEIIFYPNQYQKSSDNLNVLIASATKEHPVPFTCLVQETNYAKSQYRNYVFKGFC